MSLRLPKVSTTLLSLFLVPTIITLAFVVPNGFAMGVPMTYALGSSLWGFVALSGCLGLLLDAPRLSRLRFPATLATGAPLALVYALACTAILLSFESTQAAKAIALLPMPGTQVIVHSLDGDGGAEQRVVIERFSRRVTLLGHPVSGFRTKSASVVLSASDAVRLDALLEDSGILHVALAHPPEQGRTSAFVDLVPDSTEAGR